MFIHPSSHIANLQSVVDICIFVCFIVHMTTYIGVAATRYSPQLARRPE